MRSNFLEGITRPCVFTPTAVTNPRHSPLAMHNRLRMQVVGPDEHGNQVTKQEMDHVHNVMNTYGLSKLVSLLAGGALNASDWIGGIRIGTDATAASSNDAALVASTASLDLTDAGDVIEAGARTLRCVATFASSQPAGAAQIREIGLYVFSNSTSGLVNRIDLTGANSVNKGASDSIQVSMDIVMTTA